MVTRIRNVALAGCTAVCSALYGQGAPPAKAPAPIAIANAGNNNDKRIDATIRKKLASSKIGRDGFTFRVQGGAVYWEGTTGVPQHKGAATRMAKAAGAVRVVNNIRVSQAAKNAATGNPEQGPRRVQIKHDDAPSK